MNSNYLLSLWIYHSARVNLVQTSWFSSRIPGVLDHLCSNHSDQVRDKIHTFNFMMHFFDFKSWFFIFRIISLRGQSVPRPTLFSLSRGSSVHLSKERKAPRTLCQHKERSSILYSPIESAPTARLLQKTKHYPLFCNFFSPKGFNMLLIVV